MFSDLDFALATVYENAPVIEGDKNCAVTIQRRDVITTVGEDKNTDVGKTDWITEDSVHESNTEVVDISFDQPSTSYIVSPRKNLPSPKVIPTIKKRTSSPFKATIEK